MSIYVQCAIPSVTNLDRDATINTFTFAGANAADEDDRNACIGAIIGFYNEPGDDGADAPCEYLAGTLSRTAATRFKVWDASLPLGEPVAEGEGTPLGVTGGDVSHSVQEISCCLSFTSGSDTGVGARRRRGRIYLGPLNVNAGLTNIGPLFAKPLDNFIVDILESAVTHLASPAEGISHAVWSRVGNTVTPIDRYSIDNDFDTQRRRQIEPTNRVVRFIS